MESALLDDNKVLTCLSSKQYAGALKEMILWSNQQLAEFLLHNVKVLDILCHEEFDDFWDKKRDDLRLPQNPEFRFVKQPGIKSAHMVSGYLLFLLELKKNPGNTTANDSKGLLEQTDLLSFHLVRRHLHFIFLDLPQCKEEDLHSFVSALYNLEAFAKVHGTPGYLLLSNGYMQLALSFRKFNLETETKEAFNLCWKYLHLASLAEVDSEASINNAYFGQGLGLSTPFNLNSIYEMKSYCKTAADTLLPLSSQSRAEQAADLMYQNVKRMMNTDKYQAVVVRP